MVFNCGKALVFNVMCVSCLSFGGASVAQEQSLKYPLNPLDSNNGLIPLPGEYNRGYFNASNLDYPKEVPPSLWPQEGLVGAPLNQGNALDYMMKIKDLIEPDMRTLVDNHEAWNAKAAGWYNMVWRGGVVPGTPGNEISGREAIMNTNTGQIVPNVSWKEEYRPTPDWVQNYGVIYYNGIAGYTLGQVFEDVYNPQPEKMVFKPGSIVVKVEAATVQPEEWPWTTEGSPPSVLHRAASWKVYRPTTQNQKDFKDEKAKGKLVLLQNKVQSVYPFQLAIKVKDPGATGESEAGWVYMGFVYDASSTGETAWDRFVPAGLMWGNDPEYADTYEGALPDEDLKETWVNPDAPPFVKDTIGWGGRFAAPMDVAVRHNVVFDGSRIAIPDDPPSDGFRVSSCLSCHGAAQHSTDPKQKGLVDNFYPAPDPAFPDDGDVFRLYFPGSEDWQRWFQNRPGTVPMSKEANVVALDYDLNSTIALMIWKAATLGASDFDDLMLGIFNGH